MTRHQLVLDLAIDIAILGSSRAQDFATEEQIQEGSRGLSGVLWRYRP